MFLGKKLFLFSFSLFLFLKCSRNTEKPPDGCKSSQTNDCFHELFFFARWNIFPKVEEQEKPREVGKSLHWKITRVTNNNNKKLHLLDERSPFVPTFVCVIFFKVSCRGNLSNVWAGHVVLFKPFINRKGKQHLFICYSLLSCNASRFIKTCNLQFFWLVVLREWVTQLWMKLTSTELSF